MQRFALMFSQTNIYIYCSPGKTRNKVKRNAEEIKVYRKRYDKYILTLMEEAVLWNMSATLLYVDYFSTSRTHLTICMIAIFSW